MPLIPRTAGLAYLAGFIAADGHLESNEPYIVIASSERSFLNDYIALLIQDQIKRKPRPYWGKTAKVWKIRIYSRQLWTVFNREYKVPTGKKAHIVLPPQNLRTPERVWYTRGWFEGEGWLEIMTVHRSSGLYQYPRIGFKVSNQPIRDWILLELNRHGVKAKKYNRRDGTLVFG